MQCCKKKIKEYIKLLSKPRKEFGGMPTCPYAQAHVNEGKMDIREWDPKKTDIMDELLKFNKDEYQSTAWFVKDMSDIFKKGTSEEVDTWTNDVNKRLLEDNDVEFVMVTFNPNDKYSVDGYNPRSLAPYFIIGVVYLEELNDSHEKLEDSKYFENLTGEYKEQLV